MARNVRNSMVAAPDNLELARLERVARCGPGVHPLRAVRGLEEYGEQAIEPLLRLLNARNVEVAAAAAAALGRIGDERITEPLLQALRRCFVGRSARFNLWLGLSVCAACVLLMIPLVGAGWLLKIGLVPTMVSHYAWLAYRDFRRKRSPLVKAIIEALAEIAERHPTAQLTTAVKDLRAVAADRLQQTTETRKASLRAAVRIEVLLGNLRDLPVAAAAPEAISGSLPVPAHQPEPETETLPRVGA